MTKQEVPTNTAATSKESIEEMVRQLERELDKEFEDFEGKKYACPATAVVAETPEQVTEAMAELETFENENEQFNNSFVKIVEESETQMKTVEAARDTLRSRVLEATPVSA